MFFFRLLPPVYSFHGTQLCPSQGRIGYCTEKTSPLPFMEPTLKKLPSLDYVKGLTQKLLEQVDYIRHRLNLDNTLSRRANMEEANIERNQNKRLFGRGDPLRGMDLNGILDYIGVKLFPFYGILGPLVVYSICILVLWHALIWILESIVMTAVSFRTYGCSPMVFMGLGGKLAWLPFLPFAKALQESHLKDNFNQLIHGNSTTSSSEGPSVPPGYDAGVYKVKKPTVWSPGREADADSATTIAALDLDPNQIEALKAVIQQGNRVQEEAAAQARTLQWELSMRNDSRILALTEHLGLNDHDLLEGRQLVLKP